jgi:hypothetical protein
MMFHRLYNYLEDKEGVGPISWGSDLLVEEVTRKHASSVIVTDLYLIVSIL